LAESQKLKIWRKSQNLFAESRHLTQALPVPKASSNPALVAAGDFFGFFGAQRLSNGNRLAKKFRINAMKIPATVAKPCRNDRQIGV
jgi:hypothetical protein